MRALRVVGITGDGAVVLEDPGRRERYTVPADEQLRAAARGDVTRLGQIAIELESQLRPREIQARIRGGASVDQVAAAAGVPVQKIERFAYPVLLERSRTAELAQGAHPQRADGPDLRTLGETVAHTFGLRGQDYAEAAWDSWKGEDGKWVVALSWRAGRSDNAAHWAFQPGAHGGTVAALDEHASDLVEGLPARPLRTVGPVIDIGRDDEPEPERPYEPESPQMRAAAAGESRTADPRRGIAPEQRRSSPPPAPRGTPAAPPSAPPPATTRGPASEPAEDPAAHRSPASGSAAHDSAAHGSPTHDPVGEPLPPAEASVERDGTGSTASAPESATTRFPDRAHGSGTTRHPDTDGSAAVPAPDDARTVDATSAADERRDAPGPATPSASDAGDTADTAAPPPEPASAPEPDGDREADAADDDGRGRSSGSGSRGAANRRTKKGKPVMPSWDEVLLGVRGQR